MLLGMQQYFRQETNSIKITSVPEALFLDECLRSKSRSRCQQDGGKEKGKDLHHFDILDNVVEVSRSRCIVGCCCLLMVDVDATTGDTTSKKQQAGKKLADWLTTKKNSNPSFRKK